jgi:hypothetical protein
MKARRAERECYYWLTAATRTQDEQDLKDPFKQFPNRQYFQPILTVLDNEPIVDLWKPRTMMITWLVCGWASHLGFTHPGVGVIFQGPDERRALKCIEYIKILWENSIPELQHRWPLKKPLDKQPYNRLDMANRSWFLAIPGDADRIRSDHPTVVVFDEACSIVNWEENYNVAAGARTPKIISVSSAQPSPFSDLFDSCHPVDWPDYPKN